ncbi:MAG: glycine zipper family protein [Acetobacteraceae bacterium]
MRRFIRQSPGTRTRNQIVRGLAPAGALGVALALGACAVAPPTGPTVMALPGKDKSFATFRREDAGCRQYADQQIGYAQPGQAATNAAVGSAVVGTALGAAAGAAIGSVSGNMGAGAAIGGAAGLLGGSAIGAGNAQASAGSLQERYNISYTQCMYSNGNTVVARPPGGGYQYGGYPTPAYGGYPPPPYGPYYGPAYPPGLSVGVGGGWYR